MKKVFSKLWNAYACYIWPYMKNFWGIRWADHWMRRLTTAIGEKGWVWATYKGYWIYVNLNSFHGFNVYYLNGYEPDVTSVIEERVKQGDTVLDLGGHVGIHSLTLRREIGEEGQLLLFEPDPFALFALRKTLKKNNFRNVKLIEAAVSDKAGTATLTHVLNTMFAPHTILETEVTEQASRQFTVKKVKLSDYLEKHNIDHVDFIKMDIEGSEYSVLKDLKDRLSNIDVMVIELHLKQEMQKLKVIYQILEDGTITDLTAGKKISSSEELYLIAKQSRRWILWERD